MWVLGLCCFVKHTKEDLICSSVWGGELFVVLHSEMDGGVDFDPAVDVFVSQWFVLTKRSSVS